MDTLNIVLLSYVIVVFLSYVIGIWSKFGILNSISESAYHIKNKALFTLFIWSVSIPIMIVGSTGLMFMAGALLAFVGASPMFKEDMEGKVHVVGATGGIMLGFAGMILNFGLWPLAVIQGAFTLGAILFKLKNHTWWIEVLAFILIIAGLVIAKF
jgi:hypothetical protein